MIWKYSKLDSILFLINMVQMGLNVWLAATWDMHTLSQILLLWPLFVLLSWYNPMVSTHNFLHTPWFKSELINRLYTALNSINLGLPQILYHYHHLNHHQYSNDRKGPDGLTKDFSSTFAYGKQGQPENVILYSALSLFRRGTIEMFHEVKRQGKMKQFWFELLTCTFGLIGYLLLSWRYFLFFYVPTFFFGWFLAHLENYYEHFGAIPENRYANTVSYYGRIYNILAFNEGYHQEHHLRPGEHWTKRPEVQKALWKQLEESNRVISKFPGLLGFLDHR